jgi:predicted transcriptional regulator
MQYIGLVVEELKNQSRVNFVFTKGVGENIIKEFLNNYFELEMLKSQKFIVEDFIIIKFVTENFESLFEFKQNLYSIRQKIELLNNFSLN